MKKIIGIIFVISIMTFLSAICYASSIEVPETVRVGLFYGSKALSSFTLSSQGGLEIGVLDDDEFEIIYEVPANAEITVSKGSSTGSVYVEGYGEVGSRKEYPYFRAIEKNDVAVFSIDGKKYRGNIEVRRFSDSDMTVINHLSMQEYLYGVVPREIGGNSPIEAVKAQAIIARTYAAKNYGRRDNWGFDFYPTVDDQAYGGYEWENENSNLAVDETDGQVVVYDGELIGGYYFSTSGGYTESSENVWGGEYEYLQAVPDYYEPEIEGNTTWEVDYTADEIKQKLQNHDIYVGDIIDLIPTEFTEAGRVLELKVVGTAGETVLTKAKTREYLGLKSQWYTVNDEAPEVIEVSEDELPSASKDDYWWLNDGLNDNEEDDEEEEYIKIDTDYTQGGGKVVEDTINPEEMKPLLKAIVNKILNEKVETFNTEYKAANNKTTFTFRGRGWGHAVGMSQNGAKGMAEEGFSCEEIICWYYSGVEIVNDN